MPDRRNRTVLGMATAAVAIVTGCSNAGTDVPAAPDQPSTESSVRTYRNGDFTATGWYGSLPSNIEVTVTLADGVITDAVVTAHATDPISRDYQDRFADAAPALVVGRPIDEVHLDHVAGSSGTPEGFNDALNKIKAASGT